ncbi:hypothetical protein [Zoogloea sp. 1C4]|uniref:hypothetical protein n=1 Tax=Zoogloea sp. 1C4 TaxID=2570190 RepID=UPI00129121F1|nr:hypothetical protein [Zoogloea sp. 1C4]
MDKNIKAELIDPLSKSELSQPHPIGESIHKFIIAIEDHQAAVITTLPLLITKHNQELKETKRLLDSYLSEKKEDGTAVLAASGAHAASKMLSAVRSMGYLQKSNTIKAVLNSLFVSLFSELDFFTGDLLTNIYLSKPELFKGIRRELALCEILDLGNIEAVKMDMLEKEIDSIRRESYVEQFAELERRFDIRTLRKFDEWEEFVEMTQRRNLIVHNGGRVSQQYLTVCKKEGVKIDKGCQAGSFIHIEPEYLLRATTILSKIGFMLGHTLWMKTNPSERDLISESMESAVYDKLTKKKWNAALHFGLFSLTEGMKKGISETSLRVRIINTAFAFHSINKKNEANELLDSMDWKASLRDFRLAVAVIKEDYSLANRLMQEIGKNGEIVNEISYHQWPLFEKFRDSNEFEEGYQNVYGRSFRDEIAKAVEDASRSSVPSRDENGGPLETHVN